MAGIEPASPVYRTGALPLSHIGVCEWLAQLEPMTGVEPAFPPYERGVLPLNDIGVCWTWSRRQDSNLPHVAYETTAQPIGPRRHVVACATVDRGRNRTLLKTIPTLVLPLPLTRPPEPCAPAPGPIRCPG